MSVSLAPLSEIVTVKRLLVLSVVVLPDAQPLHTDFGSTPLAASAKASAIVSPLATVPLALPRITEVAVGAVLSSLTLLVSCAAADALPAASRVVTENEGVPSGPVREKLPLAVVPVVVRDAVPEVPPVTDQSAAVASDVTPVSWMPPSATPTEPRHQPFVVVPEQE